MVLSALVPLGKLSASLAGVVVPGAGALAEVSGLDALPSQLGLEAAPDGTLTWGGPPPENMAQRFAGDALQSTHNVTNRVSDKVANVAAVVVERTGIEGIDPTQLPDDAVGHDLRRGVMRSASSGISTVTQLSEDLSEDASGVQLEVMTPVEQWQQQREVQASSSSAADMAASAPPTEAPPPPKANGFVARLFGAESALPTARAHGHTNLLEKQREVTSLDPKILGG